MEIINNFIESNYIVIFVNNYYLICKLKDK